MNAGVYVWQTGYTHGNICLYINVRNDYCFRRRVSRNDMLRHLEISVVFLELQCAVVRCSVSQCVAACCSAFLVLRHLEINAGVCAWQSGHMYRCIHI